MNLVDNQSSLLQTMFFIPNLKHLNHKDVKMLNLFQKSTNFALDFFNEYSNKSSTLRWRLGFLYDCCSMKQKKTTPLNLYLWIQLCYNFSDIKVSQTEGTNNKLHKGIENRDFEEGLKRCFLITNFEIVFIKIIFIFKWEDVKSI